MKNLYVIIALLGILNQGIAQNAYYDALFCANLNDEDLNSQNDDGLTPGEKKVLEECQLFKNDPFNKPKPDFARVRAILQKQRAIGLAVRDYENQFAGASILSLAAPLLNFSRLSTAQVDTLLYGLTIYFADEFRRGYMQTYLNTFEKSIGKTAELEILFPATYEKLRTFDPIRYKEIGNELKLVFNEDLSSSLEHLISHVESPESFQLKTNQVFALLNPAFCNTLKNKREYQHFKLSAEIAQKLIDGVHPADIIGYLDAKYYDDGGTTLTELGKSFHLLNILQRNLRDTTAKVNGQFPNVWINFEKLSQLNTSKKQQYFLALLMNEDSSFFNNTLNPIRISSSSTFNDLKSKCKLTDLLSTLVKIDEFIKLKNKTLFEEQNFLPLMKLTGDLVKLALTQENQGRAEHYISLSNEVFLTYNAIRTKNYGNLPAQIGNIIKLLTKNNSGSDVVGIPVINLVKGVIAKLDATTDPLNNANAYRKIIDSPFGPLLGSYDSNEKELYHLFNNRNKSIPAFTKYNQYIDERLNKSLYTSNNDAFINTLTAEIDAFAKKDFTSKWQQEITKLVNDALVARRGETLNEALITSLTTTIKTGLESKNIYIKIDSTLVNIAQNSKAIPLIQQIDKWSGFMSAAVNAKTSEDVKAVVKRYVNPPSSYIDKRNHPFTLTIGGMPGLYVGREKLVDTAGKSECKSTFGLTLPIGIDISFKFLKASSLSLFASIIDLGALLSYRLNTNANTLPDEFNFKQFLSPGLSLGWGFPNTPITLSAGYQYAPQLRKLDKDATSEVLSNAHRWQLRVAYDIPLFSIVKSKRK
ncbi:hypothetical protein [Runella aurantiaca]|uniref:Outer membrane protein beta-barrel domain-containing protein n=1 Tax=Runella aurantiaca TaxID=2282308 RepID=A0A369I1M5_9BACT|nr:hypothetical protein [Runella aurantiaca]RDB03669.1 hypothetical protein DVG78_22435 [Runella aurantiaca]